MCTAGGSLSRGYVWPNVYIDIGLRNAHLEGVFESLVHAIDIFRLWDTAAGTDEVNVYQRIYGPLRIPLSASGRLDQLDGNNPLLVVMGGPFVLVQGLLVLGTELVYGTIYIVPGGRNDVGVAPLINDPTPLRLMGGGRRRSMRPWKSHQSGSNPIPTYLLSGQRRFIWSIHKLLPYPK